MQAYAQSLLEGIPPEDPYDMPLVLSGSWTFVTKNDHQNLQVTISRQPLAFFWVCVFSTRLNLFQNTLAHHVVVKVNLMC